MNDSIHNKLAEFVTTKDYKPCKILVGKKELATIIEEMDTKRRYSLYSPTDMDSSIQFCYGSLTLEIVPVPIDSMLEVIPSPRRCLYSWEPNND